MPRPGNLTDAQFPDLEQLSRAAEAFELLEQHPGWGLLMELLDAERSATLRGLQSGVKEQAEYAFAHGRVGGLHAAQDIMQTVIAKAAERLAEDEALDTNAGAGRS